MTVDYKNVSVMEFEDYVKTNLSNRE